MILTLQNLRFALNISIYLFRTIVSIIVISIIIISYRPASRGYWHFSARGRTRAAEAVRGRELVDQPVNMGLIRAHITISRYFR